MQFKNIAAFVSLAVMASALPTEDIVARTDSTTCTLTNSQTGQTTCCNKGLLGLLVGCLTIPVLGCNNNQQQVCCPTNPQTGFIVVGAPCIPISL